MALRKKGMPVSKVIISIFVGILYFITSALYLNRPVLNFDIILEDGSRKIVGNPGYKKSLAIIIKQDLLSIDNVILSRNFLAIHKMDDYTYISIKSMFLPVSIFSVVNTKALSYIVINKLKESISNPIFENTYSHVSINPVSRTNFFEDKNSVVKLTVISLIVSLLIFIVLINVSLQRHHANEQ